MITPPRTRGEAEQRKYGRTSYMGGLKFDPDRCAYEVGYPPSYIRWHQCHRKPGHGPDSLYCKQHAKMVE